MGPRGNVDSPIDVKLPGKRNQRGVDFTIRDSLISSTHTMAPVGSGLWRTLRAHQVYGANTDVGKTIVSTVLCNAVQRQKQRAAFLKPVSTGALDDADNRYDESHILSERIGAN